MSSDIRRFVVLLHDALAPHGFARVPAVSLAKLATPLANGPQLEIDDVQSDRGVEGRKQQQPLPPLREADHVGAN